jgi:hypothetical protein
MRSVAQPLLAVRPPSRRFAPRCRRPSRLRAKSRSPRTSWASGASRRSQSHQELPQVNKVTAFFRLDDPATGLLNSPTFLCAKSAVMATAFSRSTMQIMAPPAPFTRRATHLRREAAPVGTRSRRRTGDTGATAGQRYIKKNPQGRATPPQRTQTWRALGTRVTAADGPGLQGIKPDAGLKPLRSSGQALRFRFAPLRASRRYVKGEIRSREKAVRLCRS